MADGVRQAAEHDTGMPAASRTVFLILKDSYNLRNYLRPDMLREMEASGCRFVVLAPEPNSEHLRQTFSHPCFQLEKLELEKIDRLMRGSRLYQFLRLVRNYTYGGARMDELGTRRHLLRTQHREGINRSNFFGRVFLHTVQATAPWTSRWRFLRDLIVWIEERLYTPDLHRDLYERYRPSLIVVPSLGYGYDAFTMREAKAHGVRSLSIVKSWDNTTSRGYGGARPDHVFAWSNIMRREIARYHDVPAEKIQVCGIPAWDSYFQDVQLRSREQFRAEFGVSPGEKILYYATTSPDINRHNNVVLRQILEAIRDGRIHHRTKVIVGLHPMFQTLKEKWGREIDRLQVSGDEVKAEFGDSVVFCAQDVEVVDKFRILLESNQIRLKEFLSYSDVMVTFYSTQCIEAALFDLPIINVGYVPFRDGEFPMSICEEFDHLRRIIATGGMTNAHDLNGLISAINADLDDRGRLAAERRVLADQEVHAHRGSAGVFTARELIRLI